MSVFDDVVVGKLKLKGKPLDVRAVGISKKKKKKKKHSSKIYDQFSHASQGGEALLSTVDVENGDGGTGRSIDHMTPAERRYFEQVERIQLQKLEKMASKSHRDRVLEFNRYLANLSEHYDIPKVGPG